MDGIGSGNPQSRIPTTPSPSGMMATQGNYPTPPSPHMHPYKGGANTIGSGGAPNALGPQPMPPYGNQSQQFPQGNYPTRPQYPANYGPGGGGVGGTQSNPPHPNQNQYPGRPMPNQATPHSQFPSSYQQGWNPAAAQPNMNHIQNKNGPAPPPPGGSPRPLNHLKQHLLHKGGYGGNQSPTSPQSFVNGPGMHQPMGPPQMQGPIGSHQGPPRIQVMFKREFIFLYLIGGKYKCIVTR